MGDSAPGGGPRMCGSPEGTRVRTQKKASMEAAVETKGRTAQSGVGKEHRAVQMLFKCNGVTFK